MLEAKLEPILGYAELKTEVFQVFREVGNSIVVHALLDRVMAVSDTQVPDSVSFFFFFFCPWPVLVLLRERSANRRMEMQRSTT